MYQKDVASPFPPPSSKNWEPLIFVKKNNPLPMPLILKENLEYDTEYGIQDMGSRLGIWIKT